MRRRHQLAAVAVSTLLATSLAACGGDDEASDPEPSESSSTTDEPTDDASDDEDRGWGSDDETTDDTDDAEDDDAAAGGSAGGAAFDGELTAPGTELALGETAYVPFSFAGDDGVIAITATEIRAGDPSEIAEAEGSEGMVPWHVTYTVEGVEGADRIGGAQPTLDAVTADGTVGGQFISFSGGVGGCETEAADSDWDGSSYESCNTTVLPEGQEATSAGFSSGDDYSVFIGEPVLWS